MKPSSLTLLSIPHPAYLYMANGMSESNKDRYEENRNICPLLSRGNSTDMRCNGNEIIRWDFLAQKKNSEQIKKMKSRK